MTIVAIFMLGFIGSLHCVGMCGPIALALPQFGRTDAKLRLVLGKLVYNSGRLVTYMALGAQFGLVGQVIFLAGFQQSLSILAGIVLFFLAVVSVKRIDFVFAAPTSVTGQWQKLTAGFFRRRSVFGLFMIGVLNGFLPCGLVYVALAGAVATGDVGSAVGFMLLFGLGTFPAMLAVSLAGNFFSVKTRKSLNRLIPITTALLAIILVLRGLSLDIPYLSPDLGKMHAPSSERIHSGH